MVPITTRARPGLMAVVCAVIALPGLVQLVGASPGATGVPPNLDSFLSAVSEATPPNARILAFGAQPALVFYRSTYLLYPRVVYSAEPTDYAHRDVSIPLSWPTLRRLARRDRAQYVIAWPLPWKANGAILLRSGPGALLETRR